MQILAMAMAPVAIILIYIYFRDKYEKEPWLLLFKAFASGVAVSIILLFMVPFLDIQFAFEENKYLKAFMDAFYRAALPEEGFKFLFLFLLIWKSKDFNEKFDGIVYAVYISLGFAAIENLLYVADGGAGVALKRAILSVPGHALFATLMGYYFSLARFSSQKFKFLSLALGSAILAHGIYDLFLFLIPIVNKWLVIVLNLGFWWFIIKLWEVGLQKISLHVEDSPFKPQ